MPVDEKIRLERLAATRTAASAGALDEMVWDAGLVLRTAPDEVLILPQIGAAARRRLLALDPHAIIIPEQSYAGAWVAEDRALSLLERLAEWEPPRVRPALAQGSIAGVAAKVWFEGGRALILTTAPYAHELEERLHE